MRKILFRGLDHAGKWHKGSLITRIEESPVPGTAVPYEVHYIKGQDFAGEEHEVDPETIEQLAFPATVRHPDIWEGDVIEDKYIRRIVVSYETLSCNARAYVETPYELEHKPIDEFFFQDLFQKGKPEIVGSIHDLPPKKRPFAQPHEKGITS